MATTPSLWRPMTAELPVLSTVQNLSAAFYSAEPGVLGIQMRNKLPQGELVLVAASRPHNQYWYQSVQIEGSALSVSMDGFDAAWSSCGDSDWSLSLGRLTKSGVILYPLRKGGSASYVKELDAFFCDDRRRYHDPAGSFTRNSIPYEVIPRYTGKFYSLSLLAVPAEDRYAEQISCCLQDFSLTAEGIHISALCPIDMEQPKGFSFHRTGSVQPATLFFPAKPVDIREPCLIEATVPVSALEGLTGQWELTGIFRRENGLLLRFPMRLGESDPEQAPLQSRWESNPFLRQKEQNCYLSVTEDHRLVLDFSAEDPGVQYSSCHTLAEYLNSEEQKEQYVVTAFSAGGENWQWRLRFPNLDLTDADEVTLCLCKAKSPTRVLCPVTKIVPDGTGSIITADLSGLIDTLENSLITNWLVCLAVRRGVRFWYLPVLDPLHTRYESKVIPEVYTSHTDLERQSIGETEFAGQTVEGFQNWLWTYNGRMVLTTANQCLRHMSAFSCRALDAKLRFGKLSLNIHCPEVDGGKWVGVVLTHRYKLEADRKDYFFPAKVRKGQGYNYILTVSIDVKKLAFPPLYWDIRAVFERDGVRFWSSVKAPFRTGKTSDIIKESGIKKLFFGESVVLDEANQLFLYRTVGNRFALVCQERTPYSGFLFRLKERFALLLYTLFRKQLKKKSIMLTYEKYCCMAQDNGFYFFKHCMDSHVEQTLKRNIYFVIDKKAVDYQKNLLPYKDHVIQFMSLKHMVYLLAARLLVSSDSKAHAYAWRCKESIIQPYIEKHRKLVFLQHGVIALKKVEFFSSGTNSVDLFVTSNDMEHDIIINELGYQPQEVIITGLTRWDVLEDRSAQMDKKTILIMPTWRNWLEEVSDESFRASDYYQNYMALLNSPRLEAYLEQNDLYLNFYIHPKFREYIGNFSISGDRVRLIPFGTEPLNQLMMECSLLITDYSSVCWDVFYQAKPVIFYQFDVDKYNETQGAYIDLEHDLFGDRAVNNDQLFALMEEYAANGFQLKPQYAEMRKHLYKYIDRSNSQRVCDEIQKRNW